MDAETKNSTLKKLANIISVIGFSDEFLNNDVLDSYHSLLDTNLKNSLKTKLNILGNKLQFKKFFHDDYFINGHSGLENAEVKYLSEINLISKYL